MNIFANKSIWKKLVIALIVITLIGFMAPKPVAAGVGGTLMEPICDLLVGLCDGIINVIHKVILKQEVSIINIDTNGGLATLFRIVVTLLCFAVMAALIAGVAVGGVALVAKVIAVAGGEAFSWSVVISKALTGTVIALALAGGGWAGFKAYSIDYWDNKKIDIPIFSITPEEIFRGDIPLFNVNFFNPEKGEMNYSWLSEANNLVVEKTYEDNGNKTPEQAFNEWLANSNNEVYKSLSLSKIKSNAFKVGDPYVSPKNQNWTRKEYYCNNVVNEKTNEIKGSFKLCIDTEADPTNPSNADGRIVNIVLYENDWANGQIHAFSYELQEVVQTWYYVLFTVAVVGMMSVLVYIGIRILIASVSSQKAKYKQMLMDWAIGMILLFTMQYIMVLSNFFVDKLTSMFKAVSPRIYYQYLEADKNGKVEKALTDAGFIIVDKETEKTVGEDNPQYVYKDEDTKPGTTYLQMRTSNLMGQLRYDVKYNKKNSEGYIGYTILYIVMVIYLCMFIWTYIRRVIYMAFLTMISPLVALTYPIDKANDGKAQGFDVWFKEYVFNLLIQPLHLLLYTILISSAIQLATENMIYSIIAIGFMTPAEKLLRTMFNFQKAQTPGIFGGVAGGALVMSGMRWLMGHGPRGGSKGSGGEDGGDGKIKEKGEIFKDPDAKVDPGIVPGTPEAPGIPELPENTNMSKHSDKALDYYRDRLKDSQDPNAKETLENLQKEAERREALKKDGSKDPDQKDPEESKTENPEETDNSKSKRSIKRSALIMADAYKSNMANKLSKRLKRADPARFAGRWALRGLGAATLGTVGLAAGVASGNAGNAAKYAGVGIAGGFKLGGATFDSMSRALDGGNAGEEAVRAYMGEKEYKKMKVRQQMQETLRDERNIRKVEEKFNIDRLDAKKKMKEMVPEYYNYNVYDFDRMIEIENAYEKKFKQDDNDKKGRARATLAANIVDQYGLNSQLSAAKRKERFENAVDQYRKQYTRDQMRTIFNDYAQRYIDVKENMK